MDSWLLWFLLLQSVFQYPQPVGDGLDDMTRLRMEARAKFLEDEKIRLERELEQLVLKQGVWAWGDLLWSALQHWQVWALAGLLHFLLALWYIWRKRSLRREEHEEANDGANEENGGNEGEEEENDVNGEENTSDDGSAQEVDNVAANEEGGVGNGAGNEAANAANVDANQEDGGNEEEEGENDVNGDENNSDDGSAQEVNNVAANEVGVGNEAGNEAAKAANVDANKEDGGNEEEEDENDVNGDENNSDDGSAQEVDNVAANEEGGVGNEAGNEAANAANVDANRDRDDAIGRMVMECIKWPEEDVQRGCSWVTALMNNFAFHFQCVLANSFYPVLEPAIGVGSAFEGWSPREQDTVYQVLIPMTSPRGHSFHLEPETEWQRQERNFRIRVQQECTCLRKQWDKKRLCFLHHPEEELRRNQDPSLLETLCTDSYLDVQKTALWFYQLVRAVWPALPQAHNWHLTMLPSTRSCQFKVSNGRESYRIEMLFGVRIGNSDIFASSELRGYSIPSTIWTETYAVAEVKFFNYIARQAPPDSSHLKCLQFCICLCLQLGLRFSTYTTKTIVMQLLNDLPPSWWSRRHFVRRLIDISECLCTCVEVRRLNHFIVGNRRLPQGISLSLHILMSRPWNLFHDLVMDPAAHSQAIRQCEALHRWLERIINDEQGRRFSCTQLCV